MTKKKQALIFSLIGVVFLAAITVALVMAARDRQGNEDDSPYDDVSQTAIIQTEVENIASVSVESGSNVYTAERTEFINSSGVSEEGLRIAEYDGLPADVSDYGLLASMASNVVAVNVYAEEIDDPSLYGFDTPSIKTTVSFVDGSDPVTIIVGKAVPDETGYYGMVEGQNKIYIMGSDFYSVFSVNKISYISNELIPAYTAENAVTFNTIELSGTVRDESIVITQNSNTASLFSYMLTAPENTEASQTAVEQIIDSITYGVSASKAEVLNPTADQLAEYGFDDPYSVVTYTYNDFSYELKIAQIPEDEENKRVYVMVNDVNVIYSIYAYMLPFYEYQIDDLRAPEVTGQKAQ